MRPNRFLLLLTTLLAFATAGCNRPDPVAEIRMHAFTPETTLEQAYGRLLDNMHWEKRRVDGTSYVVVEGILKEEAKPFTVAYEIKARPPAVAWFEVDGERRQVAQFAEFLSSQILARNLQP